MQDKTTTQHGDSCLCLECQTAVYHAICDATKERDEAEKAFDEFKRTVVLTLRDAGQHHAADRLEYLLAETDRTEQRWNELKRKHPREMKIFIMAVSSGPGTLGELIAEMLKKI